MDQESRIGMNGWWDEWAAALVAKVGADEWRRGCRGAEGIGEGRGEGRGGGEGGEGGGGTPTLSTLLLQKSPKPCHLPDHTTPTWRRSKLAFR